MAPNGNKAASRRSARQSDIASAPDWLKKHGRDEFKRWCIDHPSEKMTYDEWKSDEQRLAGLTLFYKAKAIFDDDSSDDENEPVEAKSQPRVVRSQSAREPKKKVSTNGTKLPQAAASSTASSPLANSGSLSPSGKRKRKAPKKFLSEEIIASDNDSDDSVDENDPPAVDKDVATLATPVITVNGRAKSSSRRPKKKPLSEETISPEDEIDDPMPIEAAANAVIASPLPVRSAPKASNATPETAPPRKTHILKLSTRKFPPEKAPFEKATNGQSATLETPTKPEATTGALDVGSGDKNDGAGVAQSHSTPVTQSTSSHILPNPPDSGSARRGLRERKPAQRRPYYHDAQLFEDAEPDAAAGEGSASHSPDIASRRVSIASLSRGVDDALLAELDEDTIAALKDEDEPDPAERKPKYFKGKGRSWKKEDSDEDEDFSMAKKKRAAKAAKAKAEQKKRGRPRKSMPQSEEFVHETASDVDPSASPVPSATAAATLSKSPIPASLANTQQRSESTKRKRAPPRKSVLSEEIVQDSSDLDDSLNSVIEITTAPARHASTPPAKKKQRARKSDQSGASTASVEESTPKQSPVFKPYTPKGTPRSARLSRQEEVVVDDTATATAAATAEPKEEEKFAVTEIPDSQKPDNDDALSMASLD